MYVRLALFEPHYLQNCTFSRLTICKQRYGSLIICQWSAPRTHTSFISLHSLVPRINLDPFIVQGILFFCLPRGGGLWVHCLWGVIVLAKEKRDLIRIHNNATRKRLIQFHMGVCNNNIRDKGFQPCASICFAASPKLIAQIIMIISLSSR